MSQQFEGPVTTVVGPAVHVHHHWGDAPKKAPDTLHMGRVCPQCSGVTWRYSNYCIHCDLDLKTWDRKNGWRRHLRRLLSFGQKLLIAAIVAVFMEPSSFAQTKSKKPVNESSVDTHLQAPYTDEALKEPSLVFGHDVAKIIAAATRLPKRDEFESRDEYLARISTALKSPAYGSVSLADDLALSVQAGQNGCDEGEPCYSYDADAEIVRFWVLDKIESANGRLWKVVRLSTDWVAAGTYQAKDVLGRMHKVRRGKEVVVRLLLPQSTSISSEAQLLRSVAKSTLIIPSGVFVGRLVPPFVAISEFEDKATLTHPVHTYTRQIDLYMEPKAAMLFADLGPTVFTKRSFGR